MSDGTVICGECGSRNIIPANLREAIEQADAARTEAAALRAALERIGNERCQLGPTGEWCTTENPSLWCVHKHARRTLAGPARAPGTGMEPGPASVDDPGGESGEPDWQEAYRRWWNWAHESGVKMQFVCKECGDGAASDEDGCCASSCKLMQSGLLEMERGRCWGQRPLGTQAQERGPGAS